MSASITITKGSGSEQLFHNDFYEFMDKISYKVCLKNAITYRDHFQPG